jgi:phosphohistidine phosphatase SixA
MQNQIQDQIATDEEKYQQLAKAIDLQSTSLSKIIKATQKEGDYVQYVVIMRHSIRFDKYSPEEFADGIKKKIYHLWDPPITKFGFQLSEDIARKFFLQSGIHLEKIITSPFLRCVQTSETIAQVIFDEFNRELNLELDPAPNTNTNTNTNRMKTKFEINYNLSEVCDRYLKSKSTEDIFNEKWKANYPNYSITEFNAFYDDYRGMNLDSFECVKNICETIKKESGNLLLVTHADNLRKIHNMLTGDVIEWKAYQADYAAFELMGRTSNDVYESLMTYNIDNHLI